MGYAWLSRDRGGLASWRRFYSLLSQWSPSVPWPFCWSFTGERSALGGRGPGPARGPGRRRPPVNTNRRGVAIDGYDPVAYFLEGQARRGSSEVTVSWGGATWHFTNTGHRDAFAADPARYAPAYGGYCAWAASRGKVASVDPRAWHIERRATLSQLQHPGEPPFHRIVLRVHSRGRRRLARSPAPPPLAPLSRRSGGGRPVSGEPGGRADPGNADARADSGRMPGGAVGPAGPTDGVRRRPAPPALIIEALLLFGGVPLLFLFDLPRGVMPAVMLLALAYAHGAGQAPQTNSEALVRPERFPAVRADAAVVCSLCRGLNGGSRAPRARETVWGGPNRRRSLAAHARHLLLFLGVSPGPALPRLLHRALRQPLQRRASPRARQRRGLCVGAQYHSPPARLCSDLLWRHPLHPNVAERAALSLRCRSSTPSTVSGSSPSASAGTSPFPAGEGRQRRLEPGRKPAGHHPADSKYSLNPCMM